MYGGASKVLASGRGIEAGELLLMWTIPQPNTRSQNCRQCLQVIRGLGCRIALMTAVEIFRSVLRDYGSTGYPLFAATVGPSLPCSGAVRDSPGGYPKRADCGVHSGGPRSIDAFTWGLCCFERRCARERSWRSFKRLV